MSEQDIMMKYGNKARKAIQAIYTAGACDARHEINQRLKAEYERGLNDAWACAVLIGGPTCNGNLSAQEVRNIFGGYVPDVFDGSISASDAIQKIQKYVSDQNAQAVKAAEAEKKALHVGDEVTDISGNICIVTNVDTHIHVIYPANGKTCKWSKNTRFVKTGNRFNSFPLT